MFATKMIHTLVAIASASLVLVAAAPAGAQPTPPPEAGPGACAKEGPGGSFEWFKNGTVIYITSSNGTKYKATCSNGNWTLVPVGMIQGGFPAPTPVSPVSAVTAHPTQLYLG